jgi:hypothetical protein
MAAPSGPMTSNIAVPARPKPGRKAAVDEPESKRKQQNRSAQRAFRERKQQLSETLEKENKELKSTNDILQNQILALQAEVEQNSTTSDALRKEVNDASQRAIVYETKWNQVLGQVSTFQQQSQESKAIIKRLQDELEHANANIRALSANLQQTTGSSLNTVSNKISHGATGSLSQATVPISAVVPQKRHLARDGCGDCEEHGACPCVDSFVDDTLQQSNRGNTRLSRQESNGSISISSLLSPEPSRNGSHSHGDVPDLINDQSSPEELETDFTTQLPSFNVPTATRCGLCKDDDPDCFCAQEEAVNNGKLLQVPIGLPMGPPRIRIKPGTCVQCQQNPEQKAYCESLALERKITQEHAEGQPDPKRSRRGRSDITIQCSEAFSIYKRYSDSGEVPNYDDVYKTILNSVPDSHRGIEIAGMGLSTEKARQFSAFETDIAGVIANLRHRGSSSSRPLSEAAMKKKERNGQSRVEQSEHD